MTRSRLLFADDHRIMIEGLKRLLGEEFDVVGEVEDGRALVAAARQLRPDVVVADISMPQMNGLEALARILETRPETRVIVLSMHLDPAYARRALEAGAAGYVVKHAAPEELVLAIRSALSGGTFVSPTLAREAPPAPGSLASAPILTLRQREILQLLAEGLPTKQVASRLSISARTVEFHKYQIMKAHGLHNATELVHFAIRRGIVSV